MSPMINKNKQENKPTRPIRVGICGVAGRMGQCLVRTVLKTPDTELVMAVGASNGVGHDVSELVAWPETTGILVERDLVAALDRTKPDVVVDLTVPKSVFLNTKLVLQRGIPCVVGATGLLPEQLTELGQLAKTQKTALLLAPNFALGVILMMKFAKEAAQYYSHAEIIERHHEKKLDAPSGTALRTAEMMAEQISKRGEAFGKGLPAEAHETHSGARGAHAAGNIPIHSVRLPGSLAHQQVLFGATGETLTIQHDTLDREAFMGGILLAIRQIVTRQGVFIGLETLMD